MCQYSFIRSFLRKTVFSCSWKKRILEICIFFFTGQRQYFKAFFVCVTHYLHLMLPVYFENPAAVLFLLPILLLILLRARNYRSVFIYWFPNKHSLKL